MSSIVHGITEHKRKYFFFQSINQFESCFVQVMELSDLHTPTCKLHASQSFEEHSPLAERRNSDASDIFLSPEAYKATQAVEFIAEHLRNEDEYVQVHALLEKTFR
jgi:hypothetical protein